MEQPESKAESPAEKRKKEDPAFAILRRVVSEKTAGDFVAHRKALKKPLTERAAELILAKLGACRDPDAVVNASIMNGWQGVFPEREAPPPTRARPERWYEVER